MEGKNAFYYNEVLNIDSLKESTIYVKYSHSNHDAKDDIVVDEFTLEPPSLPKCDETKKEDFSKSTKSLRSFRPKVKPVTDDGKTKHNLSKESEMEKAKIRQFEEILSITSHQPNSHTKSEEYYFIDSDEEDKYHTNAGVIGEGGTCSNENCLLVCIVRMRLHFVAGMTDFDFFFLPKQRLNHKKITKN